MLRRTRLLRCWGGLLFSTKSRPPAFCLTAKLEAHKDPVVWISSSRRFSSIDVADMKKASPSEDLLLHQLKNANSVERVLNMSSTHSDIMNTAHVTRALKTLFMLYKASSNDVGRRDVLQNEGFNKLCKQLKRQARTLTLSDTVDSLKVLSFVGVSSKSLIMQTLLQLIRHQVNDLSLNQIVYLDFLLHKLESCPLVNALKIALPIIFEAHLVVKLDREDVSHLSLMLQFCRNRRVSKESVEEILAALRRHGSSLGSVKNVVSVMECLSDLGWTSPNHRIVLASAFEAMACVIHQCSPSELITTVRKLAKSTSRSDECFYNEPFLNAVTRGALEQNFSLQHLTWLNRHLMKIGYVNVKILDQIAQKVEDEQSVLMPSVFLNTVSSFAYANYKPSNWANILPTFLLSAKEYLHRNDLPWLSFAGSLAVLGEYPTWLFEKVFDEDFLKVFLAREYNLIDSLHLLLLYQAVSTLCPSYKGRMPPRDLVEKAAARNGTHTMATPVLHALEKGLGGRAYVSSGLETKLGHFIDHAIVMRKGGYPVAVQPVEESTTRLLVEELPSPPDSHRILILVFHPSSYARNCDLLRGIHCLQVATLRALGHVVMPVSYKSWTKLPDHEKIPYLMQNIQLLCEEQNNEQQKTTSSSSSSVLN